MAKKKQAKKHKFKYSDPVMSAATGVPAASVAQRGDLRPPQALHSGQPARDFSYVSRDLRRILVLAASLVMLEIVLYYLVTRTGLGPALNGFLLHG